jgi:hypothetical protein
MRESCISTGTEMKRQSCTDHSNDIVGDPEVDDNPPTFSEESRILRNKKAVCFPRFGVVGVAPIKNSWLVCNRRNLN